MIGDEAMCWPEERAIFAWFAANRDTQAIRCLKDVRFYCVFYAAEVENLFLFLCFVLYFFWFFILNDLWLVLLCSVKFLLPFTPFFIAIIDSNDVESAAL
ncbi:hypothetical protein I5L12_03395 [Serratia marcescens]|nr:hypothetical protein [Serratia marcescens]